MASSSHAAWQPDWAVAPGEILLEALEERGMSQSELSHRLGRPLKTVNEIIKGKAAITPETAIQLERALGISARFWTGLETQYRDTLARLEAERELEAQTNWLEGFPVADMVRHGLITPGGSKAERLGKVLSFLGISSPAAFDRLDAVASYRSSPAFRASPKAVAAWLRWGEIRATAIDAPTFDAKRFRAVLDEVRPLTRNEPFDQVFKRVQALCLTAGVIVILVPELSGTHLSGAARWIGSKAVIQLTLRHKTDDQFWFTFFHEAGHLLSGGRKRDYVDGAGGDGGEEGEAEANAFARDLLLPPHAYRAFVEAADFTRPAIKSFAKARGVSSGIVVGRLQRDGHVPPSQLRDLKRSINLTAA